ncbi:MAG: HAMP domain-containing protein [Candidatus Zixiibacteriota bacterium]|nr:MAG: HAMP domain-containing protein [candidate division Zixibacteria bacterium]
MKSSFGKRLFRLFLLFSLVPAIILAAIGYYVASHDRLEGLTDESESSTELVEYYNRFLFEVIKTEISSKPMPPVEPDETLQFLLTVNDTGFSVLGSSPLFTRKVAEVIASTAHAKPFGFVKIDGLYYQFNTLKTDDGEMLAGGLIHPDIYTDRLTALQSHYAAVSSQRELTTNYLLFLALVFLIVAAVTVSLAYYFSSRLARNLASPLTRLSEASQRIANGDFEQQVEPGGIGEVKTLIDNFNQMAAQLRTTTLRLAQTERVAAWRNIARRFAHELKNPLQPIMISIHRLEKALRDSELYGELQQPLQAASEELRHLTELADRFSQLAKLPEPRIEVVDMNEFLKTISDLYRELLSDYDYCLKLPDRTVTVRIDQTYFREAIHNLLQNAVDASTQGCRIELRLKTDRDRAVIEVRDFGQGMSSEIVSSAPLPYFTTKAEGSGIGLAVVEKIVNDLSGSMMIDSKENEGTMVALSIPLYNDHGR